MLFAERAGACVGLASMLVFVMAGLAHAAAPAVDKFERLSAAAAAPTLELRDTTGKLHRLSDYHGKVVLVNFWASWCEPCRDEMPSMDKLKQRMDGARGSEFVILAVNYAEGEARVAQFLRQYPLRFPLLLDPFGEAWRSWKPGLLPASFLIGRDGRLRYRVLGEIDWAGAAAEKVVLRLLHEQPGLRQ